MSNAEVDDIIATAMKFSASQDDNESKD